jgi:hypothetical protein
MRPGGMAYITVHDKHTADLIMNHLDRVPYWEELKNFLLSYDRNSELGKLDYYIYCVAPESQVFYDIDHLRRHWGRILKIISVTQEAYGGQTAVLMENSAQPKAPAPTRRSESNSNAVMSEGGTADRASGNDPAQ